MAGLLAMCLAVRSVIPAVRPPHRVAVLEGGTGGSALARLLQAGPGFRFEAVAPPDPSPPALSAAGVRTALLPANSPRLSERPRFTAHGVDLLTEPAFWERHLRRVDLSSLAPTWFAGLDAPPNRLQAATRRAGDIVLALLLLAFTLPLMVAIAALIRLDGPGPVLYRQERVGLHGRSFVLLKFRSMRPDAEARGPVWAQRGDPRTTRVGAFLRLTRIDELPQLLNILRGEMAFIGPRPERPHFVGQLAAAIPFYKERLRVKPGLTGWAQVNLPYGASVEDARAKLSYDLFYIKNRSPALDASILVATVRVILFQQGAR